MFSPRLPSLVTLLLCARFAPIPQACWSAERTAASESTVIRQALAEWRRLRSLEFSWYATFRYTGPPGKNPYEVPSFTVSGLFRWRDDGAYYLERYESFRGQPERIIISELRGTRYTQTGPQLLQTSAQGLIGVDLTVKRLFGLAVLAEFATVDGYYVTDVQDTEFLNVACHALQIELVDRGGEVIEQCHVTISKNPPGAVLKAEWYTSNGQRRFDYRAVSVSQLPVPTGDSVLLALKVHVRQFLLYDKAQRSFHILATPWGVEEIRLLPRSLRLGAQLSDAAFLSQEWQHGTQLATPGATVTFLKKAQADSQEPSSPATTAEHESRDAVVVQLEDQLAEASTWGLVLVVAGLVCLTIALVVRWRYR